MKKSNLIIIKAFLGALLGIVVFFFIAALADTANPLLFIMMILWGIGIIFSFPFYLHRMPQINTWLKIGVLSYFAFGGGILIAIIFFGYFLFVILLGWAYGIYLMIQDILN